MTTAARGRGSGVVIRDENAADAAAIDAVHRAAFPTALEAQLVAALRAAGRSRISLVAEIDGRIVGHVLFSPVTVEHGSARGLGLAPVAVVPAVQRRGVGSALVRAGLEAARRNGTEFVVVLGNPVYYGRFGFRTASGFGLGNEYGADAEFMVIELVPTTLAGLQGLVKYAPEFSPFSE